MWSKDIKVVFSGKALLDSKPSGVVALLCQPCYENYNKKNINTSYLLCVRDLGSLWSFKVQYREAELKEIWIMYFSSGKRKTISTSDVRSREPITTTHHFCCNHTLFTSSMHFPIIVFSLSTGTYSREYLRPCTRTGSVLISAIITETCFGYNRCSSGTPSNVGCNIWGQSEVSVLTA